MTATINEALRMWRREGITLLPPNNEADITATLNKTGRKYSRDVVDLYCATGGMEDWHMDSNAWSLWSLNRVAAENLNYERPHILFADFLIRSHLYCFRYEDEARSSVCIDCFDGQEPERVADSVPDFLKMYLEHSEKLAIF